MLVVTELTLFFEDDKQEQAAGLTLTIMLVMYTMYQSISDEMAKTAYLKMIDFWLIFCLLVPFFTFLIEASWAINQFGAKPGKNRKNFDGRCWTKILSRAYIKYLVPGITIAFVTAYFTAAISIRSTA